MHPYAALTPDVVLDAVDARGPAPRRPAARLNSYENRVYQVWLEDGTRGRGEVLPPGALERRADRRGARVRARARRARDPGGRAARAARCTFGDFRFAVYPRRGGRAPELDDPKTLRMDRPLHRAHPRGRRDEDPSSIAKRSTPKTLRPRAARLPAGDRLHSGRSARRLEGGHRAGARAASTLLRARRRREPSACTATAIPATCCGPTDGPHFVDLDDARMGPAMQDLWMLLSGDRAAMTRQLRRRARRLRGLHGLRSPRAASARGAAHAAPDPLLGVDRAALGRSRRFPAAFPWFNTQRYWQDRILELREQIALMEEEPLVVD